MMYLPVVTWPTGTVQMVAQRRKYSANVFDPSAGLMIAWASATPSVGFSQL